MREFSEADKNLLQYLTNDKAIKREIDGKIYHSKQGFLIFCDLLGINYFDFEDKEYSLVFAYLDDAAYGHSDILDRVFNTVLLLKYLEQNHLILFSSFSDDSNELIHPEFQKFEDLGWMKKTPIPDNMPNVTSMHGSVPMRTYKSKTSVAGDISRYCRSIYFIPEELKSLVNRNFKSQSQIEIEKQLNQSKTQTKWAVFSCIIAAIAVLISLIR